MCVRAGTTMERLFYLKITKRMVLPLVLLPLNKKQATDDYFLQRLLVVLQGVLKDHISLSKLPRSSVKQGLVVDTTQSPSTVKVSQSVAASITGSGGNGSKGKSLFFVNAGDDLRFYYHFRETAKQSVLTLSQKDRSHSSSDEKLDFTGSTEATVELDRYEGGKFQSFMVTEHELVIEMTNDYEPKTPTSGTCGNNVISRYFGKYAHILYTLLSKLFLYMSIVQSTNNSSSSGGGSGKFAKRVNPKDSGRLSGNDSRLQPPPFKKVK